MKYMIGTAGIAGVVAFAMVAWSVAGRLMIQKDDISVMMGVAIVVLLVGLMAAGVAGVVRRFFKQAEETASLDCDKKDEKICR